MGAAGTTSITGLGGHAPQLLVLDGQQRLSSLYQALYGVGNQRFFVDLAALMHGADIETAVKVYSASRAKQWAPIQGQARALMFPLARFRLSAQLGR